MKPVLFELFGMKIYGYGTMIAIGIICAFLLLNARSKKRGYDDESILNMTVITIISGILGAKLLYIITDIKIIIKNPLILKDFGSGFVIYGGIIGGILAVITYCRIKRWNVLRVFDLAIPSVPLAQGFGRIGCFLAGCCYGKETTLPIGVEFTNSLFAPCGVKLHPTQLYSSVFDFGLALFLLWYGKKEKEDGKLFSMYIIIYSIGRFLVEVFRNDPRGNVGIFSTSQFIAIFTLVIGIMLYNIRKFKSVK
ncbi:prolipoprotein diacylglyceryl transferase [Clostridium aestuarii]|uniref:Phosphatidylglycerol--prolipoprotein diacylglyceryl transferase n=1 Tax=Clostridium aestuarii TaxID=338193 RepID=A0ABT4D0Z9_9CLOT|nr:prolipoprotein diacylglyceryl transferase [Clostridium aestuarii]MCY6484922.1 prolipoprotein diacylglyceryl transferase [Clostridium aestuarii]